MASKSGALCYLYHALFCKENEQTKWQARAQLVSIYFDNVLLLDTVFNVRKISYFSFSVSCPNIF